MKRNHKNPQTVKPVEIADRNVIIDFLCEEHDRQMLIAKKAEEEAIEMIKWMEFFEKASIPDFNMAVLEWRKAGF